MENQDKELNEDLIANIVRKATRVRNASIFVKIAFIALASGLVAIFQFINPDSSGHLNIYQIFGIISAIVTSIGAIFVVMSEDDSFMQMALASKAVDKARSIEVEYYSLLEEFVEYENNTNRAIELYTATNLMRGVVERTATSQVADEQATVSLLLEASSRQLMNAMGLSNLGHWSICIYKAIKPSAESRTSLKCVAHHRSIECKLEQARVWPEGVGVAGISFAASREVIIPNLHSQDLGTMLNLGSESKPEDAQRYASIVSCPVLVNNDASPWGVVVATSDSEDHFQDGEFAGIKAVEAVRALAGMVALAVAICKKQSSVRVAAAK
jgi:hypothetical protein